MSHSALRVRPRAILLLGAVAASCGIAYQAARFMALRQVVHAQVKVAPFTIERVTFSHMADTPGGMLTGRKIMARRSDGSVSSSETIGRMPSSNFARRVEFANGAYVGLVGLVQAKASGWMRPGEVALRKRMLNNPPPDCVIVTGERFVREEALAGHAFKVVESVPEGWKQRFTSWRSPRFGCADFQFRSENELPDGTYQLATDSRLVSLALAEPDDALFQTGAGFTEMRPSEIERLFLRAEGLPDCEQCEASRTRKDRLYERRRQPDPALQ